MNSIFNVTGKMLSNSALSVILLAFGCAIQARCHGDPIKVQLKLVTGSTTITGSALLTAIGSTRTKVELTLSPGNNKKARSTAQLASSGGTCLSPKKPLRKLLSKVGGIATTVVPFSLPQLRASKALITVHVPQKATLCGQLK